MVYVIKVMIYSEGRKVNIINSLLEFSSGDISVFLHNCSYVFLVLHL